MDTNGERFAERGTLRQPRRAPGVCGGRALTLISLTLALGLPGFAARGAPVRVATFNVRNYTSTDRLVDGRYRPEYPKPEREKAALREILDACRPDVLALQEFGPAPYLEELQQDYEREHPGEGFPFGIVLEAADPERHVAVLSRIPFTRATKHRDITFDYFGGREQVRRGLLGLDFDSGGVEWTLFVVHLKSRTTDRNDDPMSAEQRLLEARAVRDLILARFPDPAAARFVVAGDFNDTRDSRPLKAFLRRGRTSITQIIPAEDTRGETWTHYYRSADNYSRVDFILASAAAMPCVVGGRGFVVDGADALAASDHRLVYADLDFTITTRKQETPPAARTSGVSGID